MIRGNERLKLIDPDFAPLQRTCERGERVRAEIVALIELDGLERKAQGGAGAGLCGGRGIHADARLRRGDRAIKLELAPEALVDQAWIDTGGKHRSRRPHVFRERSEGDENNGRKSAARTERHEFHRCEREEGCGAIGRASTGSSAGGWAQRPAGPPQTSSQLPAATGSMLHSLHGA